MRMIDLHDPKCLQSSRVLTANGTLFLFATVSQQFAYISRQFPNRFATVRCNRCNRFLAHKRIGGFGLTERLTKRLTVCVISVVAPCRLSVAVSLAESVSRSELSSREPFALPCFKKCPMLSISDCAPSVKIKRLDIISLIFKISFDFVLISMPLLCSCRSSSLAKVA